MTKQAKSSRKRMEGRLRQTHGQIPAVALVVLKKWGMKVGETYVPNRAQKRVDFAHRRGAPGRSVKQEARLQRNKRLTKMRRVINKLQRESRRLLQRTLRAK